MSVGGPSPLGTLLVQRVEAALGTSLSQQANVVSGARPDAVTQPSNPDRPDATRNELQRHPREIVDRATAQAEQQQGRHAVDKAKLDTRTAALLLARATTNSSATPSAPTTLGYAARTILALLANFPEQVPAVAGRRPLLNPDGQGSGTGDARGPRGAAGGGSSAGTGVTAGSGATAGGAAAGASAAAGAQAGAQSGATAAGATATASAAGGAAGSGATIAASAGLAAATSTGATMAGQLANALAQALQSSGMFYESHLNGLAFGKQSLAQLMQEPQALLGRTALQTGQGGTASTGSGLLGAGSGSAAARASTAVTPGGGDAAAMANTTSTASAGAAARADAAFLGTTATGTLLAAAASGGTNAVPGLDPQTQLLVRQQLDVLANQSFSWRGEAWPDAPMDWEISRRHGSPDDPDAASPAEHWATRISIQLPQLGTVQARLTLAGEQLVMHLVAPESAPLLAEHTESLRTRYASQGLLLSQISVAARDVDTAVKAEAGASGHADMASGLVSGSDTSFEPGTRSASGLGTQSDAGSSTDNNGDGAEPAAS
ncbi:flagellar hook-length control protein FliK [Parapusillimonas sp. SGNA-6]|nr:flagellar hook-length control protein FliK [Parapusillimonas sp. SGNA-6]